MTKRKDPKDFKKNGRPSHYNIQIADEICNALASSEKGLIQLCKENPHWPERANIYIWMRKHPEFRLKYTAAKEEQIEVSVDYMQDLANEPHTYIDEQGNTRVDVSMLRVKIDVFKWQASKLKPKKYGDAQNLNNENQNNTIADEAKKRAEVLEKEY